MPCTTLLAVALHLAPVTLDEPQADALAAFIADERARNSSLPPNLPRPPPRLPTRMEVLVAEHRRNGSPIDRDVSFADQRYADKLLRLAGYQDEERTACLAERARLDAEVTDDPQRASRIREQQADLTARADEASDSLLKLLKALVSATALTHLLTDEWLYLYVLELTALDRRVEAIDSLARLAAEFPHSRFLPHLELVVAFHELTHGQLLRARRLFITVLAGPARELHAHARAGLGWSFLRAAPDAPLRADLALDNFFHSYKATRPGEPADPTLRTSREHGLVHAFAAAARPDRAAEFFKKLVDTPGERREAALLERLALAYFARGEHRESATIYRALLALHPVDPRRCAWQARLLLAAILARDSVARTRETRRLAELSQQWTTDQRHEEPDRRRCRDEARALSAAAR